MPKLRVGIVNFLNSKPLAWGFLKAHHADLFEPSYHPPARVAELLARGSLDIGLIPSIELQRIPRLKVLPELCVAATQEVRSVLLLLRCPIQEIQKVAVDRNSRTAVALLKILFQESYGIDPKLVAMNAGIDQMMGDCGAALLIGDPALKVERRRFMVLDLAAAWKSLTGLPFVFAVWAVAGGVHLPRLMYYFKDSLSYGLSSMENMVRESAAELGLDSNEVREYLNDSLSFVLGEEEIRGLEEFFHRAHAYGLAPHPRPLDFWTD